MGKGREAGVGQFPGLRSQVGPPHLMTWLMTIGSGGNSKAVRRWGISENFSRGQSKI